MAEPDPYEPYFTGVLSTPDGHEVYYERVGTPGAVPAVYLHGGPGSGASPGQRKFFDPKLFDAVILDQRGSGRSRPLASEPDADLSTNTTDHLISDLESIRAICGFKKWIVFGLSWGSTLALAYALEHPESVSAVVVGLVTTTSRPEVDWISGDVGRIFPEAYDAFTSFVPQHLRHLRNVDAYAELLFDADQSVQLEAARQWMAWEGAHVSLAPHHKESTREYDDEFVLRFARLVTHYWRHSAFRGDEEIIERIGEIGHVPAVLIHGRYDVSGPLVTAYRLHKAWPASELIVLDDMGHGDGPTFVDVTKDALVKMATLVAQA